MFFVKNYTPVGAWNSSVNAFRMRSSRHAERGSAFVQLTILLGFFFAAGMTAYIFGGHVIFAKSNAEAKILSVADTLLTNTPFNLLQVADGKVEYAATETIQARLDQIRARVNASLADLSSPTGITYTDTCVSVYSFSASAGCGGTPTPYMTSSSGCERTAIPACVSYLNTLRENASACTVENHYACIVLQYSEAELPNNFVLARKVTIDMPSFAVSATTFYTGSSTEIDPIFTEPDPGPESPTPEAPDDSSGISNEDESDNLAPSDEIEDIPDLPTGGDSSASLADGNVEIENHLPEFDSKPFALPPIWYD
jgi:hypothetical protein